MEINNEKLLELALNTANNAYAPYSKFHVGACALFKDGSIYIGCNVENASYGLCLCAERNAISTAVAQGQKRELVAIAIASPNTRECYPCGACRQWISEFSADAKVIVEDKDGKPEIYSIKDLLPKAFEL